MSMHTTVSSDTTREVINRYLDSKHTDASTLADDVVFTNMATGDRHSGPEEVLGMLHYMYHVAFDADAENRSLTVEGDRAVLELDFVGTHIGEFAGIAATGKRVRVPLCVVYEMEDARIRKARIYFQVPVLMTQLQ
jgi:predicted ester cyclase